MARAPAPAGWLRCPTPASTIVRSVTSDSTPARPTRRLSATRFPVTGPRGSTASSARRCSPPFVVAVPSFADLPGVVALRDPEFWLIAVLARDRGCVAVLDPGPGPSGHGVPVDRLHVRPAAGLGAGGGGDRAGPGGPRLVDPSAPRAVAGRCSTSASTRCRSRRPSWCSVVGVARLSEDAPARRPSTLGVLAIFAAACAWFVVNELLVTTALACGSAAPWTQRVDPLAASGRSLDAEPARARPAGRRGRQRQRAAGAADAGAAVHGQRNWPVLTEEQRPALEARRADRPAQPQGALRRDAQEARTYSERRPARDRSTAGRGPAPDGAAAARHRPVPAGQRRARPRGRRPAAGRGGRTGSARRSARTASWPGSAGTSSPCSRRGWRTRMPPACWPHRVADALAEPVTLDGLPLDVTAAIGVAVYPDHGTDNTTLLRHAEVAMYDAKDRGSPVRDLHPGVGPEHARAAGAAGRPAPGPGIRHGRAAAVLPAAGGHRHAARWSASRRCCAGTTRSGVRQPRSLDQGGRAHRGDAAAHLAGDRGRDRPAGQVAGPGPDAADLDQRQRARPAPAGLRRRARHAARRPRQSRRTRSSWRSPRAR